MNSPFVFDEHKPMLVCSLSGKTESEVVCSVRSGIFDGADGFLLHLERLNPEVRTEKALHHIFSVCGHHPIMVVNFRGEDGSEDDRLAEELLMAARAGADCIDVPCDLFDRQTPEMPYVSEAAVTKQKELIAKLHEMGVQTEMSAHTPHLTTDELIAVAKYVENMGVDIVKVAMKCDTYEQSIEAYAQTYELKKVLSHPFYFGATGKYSAVHRQIAHTAGSCLVFCVEKYEPGCTLDKPLLRAVRAMWDNFHYTINN